MHGRIKVRTTEEERERKKKEQALKVKAYSAAMGKIQEKRSKEEFDDEMLQLTTQILLRNPDVATLWNVRRECIVVKTKQLLDDEERRQATYDPELGLTEQCLMVNPKSYGAWHHRCWTLENCPKANWDREVQLCNKYLKMDERNFHTWDYRRYVVSKAGVEKQQELDFCTEKIKVNFSNYSSWHNRSLLLPQLHPYEGDAVPKRPMSEQKLKEELEMVLTAAFTDPNDSSAWFYQRWLLGNSRPDLEICAFRCDNNKAVLAFTNPVSMKNAKVLVCGENAVDAKLELVRWVASNCADVDTTWLLDLPANHTLNFDTNARYQLEVNIPELAEQKLPLKFYANTFYYFNAPSRSYAFSASVLDELQSQLESCNSLLEFEPDSKWTLLTSALLMRAVDRQQYHAKSLEYLEKLQKVDLLREGYYKDLAAKWILEKLLADWSNSDEFPIKFDFQQQPQLTSIHYPQYFSIADEVTLSSSLETTYAASNKKLQTFKTLHLICK